MDMLNKIIKISLFFCFLTTPAWGAGCQSAGVSWWLEATDNPLNLSTLILAVATVALCLITLFNTLKQSKDMKKTIDIAQKSNELNSKIFLSTERPWISVQVLIGGPITYDVNGLNVSLIFRLQNVGRTPAKNVGINFSLIALDKYDNERPNRVQKELCEQAEKIPALLQPVYTLFPGETIDQPMTTNIGMGEVKSLIERDKFISPMILGCVNYEFTFESGCHQTGFRLNINRIKRSQSGIYSICIFSDDGDVPANEIQFNRGFGPGFFAN